MVDGRPFGVGWDRDAAMAAAIPSFAPLYGSCRWQEEGRRRRPNIMMADEDAVDEVKVFRSEDTDDDTIAESSQQLADDKKDVVLETEMEAGRPPVIGSKGGAFVKPSPSFQNMAAGLAAGGFSPSYPFPMLMPWFMTPAAYGIRPALSPNLCFMPAALSPSFNMFNPASPLYGAAFAKQAMDSVPLAPNMRGHPLNPLQLNQMRMPFMNPMMGNNSPKEDKRMSGGGKSKKDDHIKKPLNAFMWFMKENRPKLMEELGNKEKQSAELNKELGKRWQHLPKEEQQRYFEMAKKDREEHKQKYPQWSARENYAVHKRKKKRRDKSVESGESKKCRARFGVDNQEKWCKFCKRKKKCEYSSDRSVDGLSMDYNDQAFDAMAGSSSTGPSPLASSVGRSPVDANASDSESDVDDDDDVDPTFTQQMHEVAMQEEAII
ncbi:unnamed protein product [Caenorhabditis auriculariae]|uniref:Protein pop-1 n=1 Tax=Caenorhabditis auriculariae TaxID=2777116 RepID=A0A8S1HE46_9PELO|nr:unnamed protein product [Caenorhabditis auriculariae]